MKRKTKTIMAFLTAMTMTAGAMGVTAYAEETEKPTYTYGDHVEATPEMQPVIELKINQMKQYLTENGITEDIADEVVGYYAEGLPAKIYFNALGYDGTEAPQTEKGCKAYCLELAKLLTERSANGIDKVTNADIEDRIYKLSISAVPIDEPVNGHPAIEEYLGQKLPLECTLSEGVKFNYNPETNVIVLDGEGTVTLYDNRDIAKTAEKLDKNGNCIAGQMPVLIIGKNVKPEGMAFLTTPRLFKTYIYIGSPADEGYRSVCQWHEQHKKDMAAIGVEYYGVNTNVANYIDDDVDIYDVLNGKADISEFVLTEEAKEMLDSEKQLVEEAQKSEEQNAQSAEKKDVKIWSAEPSLKGDADVNNEVNLADLTTVAKYNLSNSSYPLANDTAYANADMNGDGKVDGLDTSALIEDQLGK